MQLPSQPVQQFIIYLWGLSNPAPHPPAHLNPFLSSVSYLNSLALIPNVNKWETAAFH